MDAFYASVEVRDNPSLLGKPIAVGGSERRGVVCSASYEARAFGVRSAQSGYKAASLCPNLIFVKPDFKKYHEASRIIREIFFEYTDLVEPLSLDEAYLDVTTNKMELSSPVIIAEEIRQLIFQRTGLTASAGVSYNKFLAKTASDINKPNGIKVISREEAADFIAALPVGKFYGIGKKTAEKLARMGIHFGSDLRALDKFELSRKFGKSGIYYYDIVRGIDNRLVKPDRRRKSIGVERTYNEDLALESQVKEKIMMLCEMLYLILKKKNIYGRTITLKLRYQDFRTLTRSKSTPHFMTQQNSIAEVLLTLFKNLLPLDQKVRLLGVSVSNLDNEEKFIDRQLTIPFQEEE